MVCNDNYVTGVRHLKYMATKVIFSPAVLFSFAIIISTNGYEAIYKEDSSTDVTNTLRDEHDKNTVKPRSSAPAFSEFPGLAHHFKSPIFFFFNSF